MIAETADDSRTFTHRSGSSPPPGDRLTLVRVREILGDDYADATDEELLEMREALYALAAITITLPARRNG